MPVWNVNGDRLHFRDEGAGHMCPFTHIERVAPLIAAHLAAAD